VLLSRIGEAIILKQLGNLKGSERALRQILAEAEAAGDQDAQARAHHDLGAVLVHQGLVDQAIPFLFRAFELYPRQAHKLRALSDLGEALKRAGRYRASRNAFMAVLKGNPPEDMRVCTMIALLELSVLTRDRLGFGRWRRETAALIDDLPPERLADLYLQLARGSAAFGRPRTARELLQKCLSVAQAFNLNEYVVAAQSALEEITSRAEATSRLGYLRPETGDGLDATPPGLAAIEGKLEELRAG
jgi:tetratricopeptide (TPR) repeat protein